jgi:cobalamin-dependent methionine synthase I
MIIVGELINSSRNKIAAAIENKDSGYIRKTAMEQIESGSDFIDVNAGTFADDEKKCLSWLITEIQKEKDIPCCIDTPEPKAMEAALSAHRGVPMINSISLEKKRYDALLPVVSGSKCKIIALCMDDQGMPQTCDQRCGIADKLINGLVGCNIALDHIYLDPLVQPIATDKNSGMECLLTIEKIMKLFPGVHTICGLSNISFGLPERKLLNRTFMAMAISRGLDAAIVNPLDNLMMANIMTALALAGRDDFCLNYIKAYRAGKFMF